MATSLSILMKEIGQALKLDNDNRDQAAYQQYVSCIYKLATNLILAMKLSGGEVIVDSRTVREVKLVQQCVERVVALVEKMETSQAKPRGLTSPHTCHVQTPTTSRLSAGAKTTVNSPQTGAQTSSTTSNTSSGSPSQVHHASPAAAQAQTSTKFVISVPPLPPENNPHTYSVSKSRSLTPMELAQKQNQSLMVAYKARMKRLNRSDFNAFNYSLTIQRKMAENIAIAQAQEEELAKKMQARNQRLEQEAIKRFAHPWGLNKEEQEQMQTYKKILEYENDSKWLQNWRNKVESNPEDPILISQLVQEILRCSDHPFTELLHKYQFKIYERLYPLVADKHEELDQIKVPFPREEWPTVEDVAELLKEFARSPVSPVEEEKREQAVMEVGLTGDNGSPNVLAQQSEIGNVQQDVGKGNHTPVQLEQGEGNPQVSSPSLDSDLVSDTWTDPLSVRAKTTDLADQGIDETHATNGATSPTETDPRDNTDIPQSADRQNTHTETKESACESLGGTEQDKPKPLGQEKSCVETGSSEDGKVQGGIDRTEEEDQAADSVADVGENTDDQMDAGKSQLERATAKTKGDLTLALEKGKDLESQLSWERQQAQILMRQVTQDYVNYDMDNTEMAEDNLDYLFDDEDSDHHEKSDCYSRAGMTKAVGPGPAETKHQPSQSETDSPQASTVAGNVTLDRSMSHPPRTSEQSFEDEESGFQSLPANLRQDVRGGADRLEGLSQEAYIRHLRSVADDIHYYLEKLLTVMTIAYEKLDTPVGKDQCAASLEEPFFKPIWKTLLRLFRVVNYKQEIVLACVMTKYANTTPEQMKVSKKFCLTNSTNSDRPYQRAITELRRVQDHYTMLSKLECVVKVCRLICECVDDHYTGTQAEEGCRKKAPTIGADDLLPVLSYVVVQSAVPQLSTECQAMTEFIQEGYMMGEEGYCLTTLRTALNYVTSLFPAAVKGP